MPFTIYANEYLQQNIQGFYNTNYVGYKKDGNPDYINDLKNTFGSFSIQKLNNAKNQLYTVLKNDLLQFNKNLTICIVPRSKAEKTYNKNQLLFKQTIKEIINELDFKDGSDYIIRHTDTKTTHLAHTEYAGNGNMPYPGITKDTSYISNNVNGKSILLIDDIYTKSINIDEDCIQALLDCGANSVLFYAIGRTNR